MKKFQSDVYSNFTYAVIDGIKYVAKYGNIYFVEKDSLKKDYTKLNEVKDKKGVYIFTEIDIQEERVIYVGESHDTSNGWDLYHRLQQHFRITQKSCLLFKVSNVNSKNEKETVAFLKDINIYYVDLSDRSAYNIKAIESFLIDYYKPKYNKLYDLGIDRY